MRALPIPLLLVLVLPFSTAGSAVVTDPPGDVLYEEVPLATLGCAVDAVDLTEVTVASDGVTLALSLEVVDLSSGLSCHGQAFPTSQVRGWRIILTSETGVRIVGAATAWPDFEAQRCLSVRVPPPPGSGEGVKDEYGCSDGLGATGNVLSWSVPLAGTVDGRAYDLRGAGASVSAIASDQWAFATSASDHVATTDVGTL